MEKVTEALEGLRKEERRLSGELDGVRRAIAALEAVMGIGPDRTQVPAQEMQVRTQEQSAPPPNAGAPTPVVPSGPYATMSLYQAAAAYLSSADEPKTAREIAEALQAGGYPTRATNFTATVRTMLHRDFSAEAWGIYPTETGSRWFTRE